MPRNYIQNKKIIKSNSDFGKLGLCGSSKFVYSEGVLDEKKKLDIAVNKLSIMKELDNIEKSNKKKSSSKGLVLSKSFDYDTITINSEKITSPENPAREYKMNKSKVKNRLFAFMNLSICKKNFYFYSISFPIHTSDNDCYRYLNIFLTRVRQIYKDFLYIWVAERQCKNDFNNTIHFHLCSHLNFSYQGLNKIMKSILVNEYNLNNNKFNYLDKKTNEIKKGYNPIKYNGIDICKNQKTKKIINFALNSNQKVLSSYLSKYISKNEVVSNKIVWHCSHLISSLFYSYCVADAQKYLSLHSEKLKIVFEVKSKFFECLIYDKVISNELMEELFEVNEILLSEFLNQK